MATEEQAQLRDEIEQEDGAAWARRILGKPEPSEAPPTREDRLARWLKDGQTDREAEQPAITPTLSEHRALEDTRRDLATPGTAYKIGAQRYAADGTLWRRTA